MPSHSSFSSGVVDGVRAVSGHILVQNGIKCISQLKQTFNSQFKAHGKPTLGSILRSFQLSNHSSLV